MLSPRELLVLLILFAASLPAVTARLYSSDEVEYFSYLRSLWFDHDVSFENEYRYFYDHNIAQSGDFHETFLERQTPAGRRINYATMGCAILWAPFYGIADAGTRVARGLGHDVPADGFSKPYVAAVAYGSAFYAFAAIVLSIGAARRVMGVTDAHAAIAGLAVWLGTPLLFYMYVAPPFSHACSAFAVALFVTVWLQVRGAWSPHGAIALGLSGALVAMVREQDILFVLGPAVDFGLTLVKGHSPELRRAPAFAKATARSRRSFSGSGASRAAVSNAVTAIAGVAAFTVGYAPQLLAYTSLNGHPRPSHFVTRKLTWYAPHAWQVLFDTAHGFFAWTPLAMLSVAGLVVLVSRGDGDARRIGLCALIMVALQVYISGAVESWTVAGAFGQRRFVALTSLLVIGLAALWRYLPHRAVLGCVTAVCVWWNVAIIAEFSIGLMDRQRLELRRNAYDAFVTLPRMAPDLAYRYFTNRGSFYRPPSGSQ
jgi:hypothetical protein